MSEGNSGWNLKKGKWQLLWLGLTGWALLLLYWQSAEVVPAWIWNVLFIAILLQNGWLLFQLHSYERKIRELHQQSEQDALTGLKNRMAFAGAAHAVEVKEEGATVVVCDIDGLKWINDSMPYKKKGKTNYHDRDSNYYLLKRKRKYGVLCKDGRLITNITLLKRDATNIIDKLSG